MDLRPDHRVTISEPPERALIELPFAVTWTVEDFDAGSAVAVGDGGWFVVIVDGELPRPGQSVVDLARRDPSCRTDPGCPDDRYLTTLGVFSTVETTLEITSLVRPKADRREREFHDISVIMVDESGNRIGENVVSRRVVLERAT